MSKKKKSSLVPDKIRIKILLPFIFTDLEWDFKRRELKEAEKKLETEVKKARYLEGNLTGVWRLLEKVEKQRDKTISIAEAFNKIVENTNKDYEELWNAYLENKEKHKKSSKEFVESMMDLIFIYNKDCSLW